MAAAMSVGGLGRPPARRSSSPRWPIALVVLLPACLSPFEARHESLSDSRDQIWMSEESQVALRAVQSRVFDTTDRIHILSAVVATLQDLGFMIEVLDEDLGIVSGKRFDANEGEDWADPSYHTYDDDTPLLFTKTYLTWGPFYHRTDLVRATVTVRKRNESQSVVRASAQFYLRAVEDPEPYRRFFQALEQALFLDAQSLPESSVDAAT
jgi:hypothetical protein